MRTVLNLGSDRNPNPASRGGQASSPGLFGCPTFTGRVRPRYRKATPASVVTGAMRLAALAADERERSAAPALEEFARPMAWGHAEAALAIAG